MHVSNPHLPFGGVGESGMGSYHGKFGFDTFSHRRAVHTRSTKVDPSLLYPPYTAGKERMVRAGLRLPDPRDVITKLPGGQLDGLLAVDDMLIISSWKTETVYRGPLGGTFTPLLTKVKAVADIGYDSKRKRLLVPRFLDDTVEVYDLK
jgi:hypothetical protein